MSATTRERSSYRAFAVTLARRTVLGPHLVRLTFTGADLDQCGDTCLDQRVKLLFPGPGDSVPVAGLLADPYFDWYGWWRALEDDRRPPIRTYTARAVRQDRREVDVDFACHGAEGPASRFALSAQPGDPLVLVGPDREVALSTEHGVTWRPGQAREVLLAGDETAAPAICSIVESLPPAVRGVALLEVVDPGDVQPLATASRVQVTWLPRGALPVGSRLVPAVQAWAGGERTVVEPPAPDLVTDGELVWEEADAGSADVPYVWVAGEAGMVTVLRRQLGAGLGLDRRSLSAMGYWRAGRAAAG